MTVGWSTRTSGTVSRCPDARVVDTRESELPPQATMHNRDMRERKSSRKLWLYNARVQLQAIKQKRRRSRRHPQRPVGCNDSLYSPLILLSLAGPCANAAFRRGS
jgi:hypothetical protein